MPRPLGDPLQLGDELCIYRIITSTKRIQRGLACREQDAQHGDGLICDRGDVRYVPLTRLMKPLPPGGGEWFSGDTIPVGARTLRVVDVRDEDADQAPVLVVQEADPKSH